MQDSQAYPVSIDSQPGGGCLADTSSHASELSLDEISQRDEAASELEITAQVLSSIRRRFFPNNFDASALFANNIDAGALLVNNIDASTLLQDRRFNSFSEKSQAGYSDDSSGSINNRDSPTENVGQQSIQHNFNVLPVSSSPCNGSFTSSPLLPHPPTHSSLDLSPQSLSPLDQTYNSSPSLNDVQSSPDSTFDSSPVLKEEVIDPSYDFTPGLSFPDDCESTVADFGIVRADNGVQQKEKKPQPKSGHLLPPCRVCGDKASGFHYGANTCEACKGFFRRSLKKDIIEYKCSGNYQCPIQKGRRNNCPLCRYNKCLAIGMSKTAIKTGRYTHEKRTKDIVEVKALNGHYTPVSSHRHGPGRDSPPAGLGAPPGMTPEQEKMLGRIYDAHKMLFPFWHKIQETGAHYLNMKIYAEKYREKKMLSYKMENTLDSHGIDIPELTPMKHDEDIGNRSSTIQLITKHLEFAITVFVKFAKAIPGFCGLPLNDQAALVKLSRFEVWMVGAHQFFNCELDVVSGPRGNSYHREELSDVMDPDFVRAMFTFSKTLQNMRLSHEETALIKCVVLTFSDRSLLSEPDKVDHIQLQLISCLEALVRDVRKFSQIMNVLVSLRDLTEWHTRISESLVLEWPTIKRNPLLLEIMSI